MIKERVPFQTVAKDRLTNAGYTPKPGIGMYWKQETKTSVVLKNKHTLELFAGYPKQTCALLVQDGNVYGLVAQDFYDLKGGIKQ